MIWSIRWRCLTISGDQQTQDSDRGSDPGAGPTQTLKLTHKNEHSHRMAKIWEKRNLVFLWRVKSRIPAPPLSLLAQKQYTLDLDTSYKNRCILFTFLHSYQTALQIRKFHLPAIYILTRLIYTNKIRKHTSHSNTTLQFDIGTGILVMNENVSCLCIILVQGLHTQTHASTSSFTHI